MLNGDLTGLDVIGPEGQPLGKHITLDLELPASTEGPDIVNKATFAEIIPDLFVGVAAGRRTGGTGRACSGGDALVRRGETARRLRAA